MLKKIIYQFQFKIVAILLAISLLTLTGCQNGTDSKLIGKWHTDGGRLDQTKTIEFLSDHTVIWYLEGGDSSISGKWAILEDGRLKEELRNGANEFVEMSEISQNDKGLILQRTGGDTWRLWR